MVRKKVGFYLIIFLILLILVFTFFSNVSNKKKELISSKPTKNEEVTYNSNIIQDINYTTVDADGNEYTITALKGEIDYSNQDIIYLSVVNASIKLKNSDIITIASDYGKYNTNNFDTIFSKNVIINYADNNIIGEYLDFSIERNSMIISREVVYSNIDNTLKADVVEINLKNKNTKIFMYENEKKVNIRSKE